MENKLLKKKKLLLTKGNKVQLASVCNELAELYMREGKYDLSKNEYKHAAKLYKELDKPINYARANRMIGEICTTLAEFDDALKYEEIHLDVAKNQRNELEIQRALASIGRTYLTKAISDAEKLDSDSLQLAHTSFLESLSACEGLKDITNLERMDMRARLYLNIGVVKEHQGDLEGGEKYMTKSILICKNHEIYDQLHHGYYTLGLLHSKNECFKKALTNFNYSLDVADRLSDKIPPLCASYVAKAEVLIKIGEFASAKHVLIKAYKLRSPNIEEKHNIEHSLKVVAALCKAEDALIMLDLNDFKKRKELFEHMGDGLVDLKIFAKAIEYYLKMLECAIACGESGQDLLPVYVSLAQTYKDNKQYKLAYEYFQKEYEISRKNPEESYKTLLNLAVVLELVKNPYEDIAVMYNKARKEAYATKNMQYVGKVISLFIRYQKKMGKLSEAEELQKELDMLGYVTSDSESDGEDDGGTPDIGNDININDLTDISDGSDEDDLNQSRQSRKRGRKIAVKLNEKGETELHTACIRGNEALVLSLLEQKHPVNHKDYCGWLPLHEASNHGHLEVVRILINHGANINDRGGITCEGITPLHDACFSGHLETAELLLDNGASPIIFDDKGRTPLDCLKAWRNETLLEPVNEALYENLVARLRTALEKVGKRANQNIPDETFNAFYEEKPANTPTRSTRGSPRITTPKKSPRVSPNKSPYAPVGTLRHSVDIEDDLNQPSCSGLRRHSSLGDKSPSTKINSITRNLSLSNNSSDDDSETSAYEYKCAMEALRNRVPESKPSPRKSKKSSAAFMLDEEIGDNWLEDDLKLNPKKKQRASNVKQNFIDSSGIRKTNSISPRARQSTGEFQSEEENNEPFTNRNSGYESGDSVHSTSSNKRKRSQTSLLESGFSRNRSDSPLNTFNYNTSPVTCVDKTSSQTYKRQQKLNSFVNKYDSEPDSTTQQTIMNQNSFQSTVRPLLAINVRIDNRLWRIPILANEVNQLTIEWLAKEAAKRYYKQEGISPSLQLMTKEGAILINEDPLSMVFISETQAEEVQSNIVSWNLPPLPERYVEACCSVKIDPCSEVRKCLDECQGTLNLKLASISINKNQLPPLFRAINRQNNLQQLDLSENTLLNEGVQQLCYVLPSLIQLRSLNISKNNITGEGIRFLSEVFTKSERTILENLTELNFSFNLFGEDTIRHLAVILQKIKLRVLNLSGCSLPEKIFQNVFNHGIILNLEYLEIFDLSYNDLNSEDIIKFISFLNIGNITNLNVSHNSTVSTSGIVKTVAANLNQYETNNIKSLNFAKCKVNDSEIWDLLRTLTKSRELDTLNLSYNTDLTAVSLRRLIQHRPSFSFINLLGSTHIVQYFDRFSFTPDCTSKIFDVNTLKIMNISINYEKYPKEAEYLISMWERQWGKRAKVKKMHERAIYFYVED